jgi:hypothetical protein
MYLKNIAIKNIGPIDELSIELPFKDNGDPKPVIFVGENGSGKTILQSQIIDGFYEISSSLFDDVGIQDGLKRSFYKISGGLNLQTGKTQGFSLLKFTDNESQNIEYFDKVGELKKDDFIDLIQDFAISPNDKKDFQKETTSINETRKEKLQNEWISGVHFYQPAYRYEEPFWKNEVFVDQVRFEDKKRFSGKLNKKIEIISSTKDNKSFLLDLVLDRFVQNANPINLILWENINLILRQILKSSGCRFGIGPRGRYRVSIMEDLAPDNSRQILPSIDNLSLGESLLLNLFINIIRHSGNHSNQLHQIQGVVAIDEIDVHLHTDLQNSVLPELISMFPKIQFIITTHSPLFLLGMKNKFEEDGFEVRNMPNGEIITTERFSEFESAYKVLKETEKFEDDIKEKIDKTTKPILFVEGDYDIRYLNKAAQLLGKNDILSKIEIRDENGYGNLDKIWKNFNNKTKLSEIIPQKVLLLYDCDTNKQDAEKSKVFKRVMPTTKKSVIDKGIENLFKKSILEKAIKDKKAYIDITSKITKTERGENVTIPEKWEVNNDEKGNLCDWICKNGTEDDFSNFKKIFEIIESTICLEETEE